MRARARTFVASATLAAAAYAAISEVEPRPAIGLGAAGARLFLEEGAFPAGPEAGSLFGWAMTAGDFDADGYDDLAIGVPFDDWLPGIVDAGSVQVRFGASQGALDLMVPVVPWNNALDPAQSFDRYGYAVAAGDFDGDGHDDLAVGLPGNDVFDGTSVVGMGGVQLHFGMLAGDGRIQAVAQFSFSQVAGGGLPGPGLEEEGFGSALAFGDFNGDGREELAVGIPRDVLLCGPTPCRSGSVMVIGLDAGGGFGGALVSPGLSGLPGRPSEGEEFGHALATGDFDHDGYDDLAIGIPSRAAGAGEVLVVYGSPASLDFADHQTFVQSAFGFVDEAGDNFGFALAAGDWNGDRFDDLAMSAVGEDYFNGHESDGVVLVGFGSAGGITTQPASLLLDQMSDLGRVESFDYFGVALASGDFDGDGVDDLAVGAHGEDYSDVATNMGAVTVFRGRAAGFGDGGVARLLYPQSFPRGLIPERPEESDVDAQFGRALAAGDFDGNGFGDLAIGAPARWLGASGAVGAAAVIYGRLFSDGFESGDDLEWSAVAR